MYTIKTTTDNDNIIRDEIFDKKSRYINTSPFETDINIYLWETLDTGTHCGYSTDIFAMKYQQHRVLIVSQWVL